MIQYSLVWQEHHITEAGLNAIENLPLNEKISTCAVNTSLRAHVFTPFGPYGPGAVSNQEDIGKSLIFSGH